MTILELSGAASVLILAVLVLRRLTLHRLPKGTFLALWWAAVCRLLIPFSIPARFSVYTLLDRLKSAGAAPAVPTPVVPTPTPVEPGVVGPLPDLPLPEAVVPAAPLPVESAGWTADPLVLVYLLGAAVCALCFGLAYLRCRREFGTALPVDSPFLTRWKGEQRIPVRIKMSDRISAPLTYGLLRPVVLMPKGTDWADEETLGYVLAHEYVHIRRGDLWMKLALALCLCIHWFNPLVWVMYRLANRDMELACDEAVVRTFGLEARPAYAMSLIRWEETRRSFMPLCGNFSKNAMEERVTAIMKLKKRTAATVVTAVLLTMAVVAGFATSCAPKAVEVPPEEPAQGQEEQSTGDQSAAPEPEKSDTPDMSAGEPEPEEPEQPKPEEPELEPEPEEPKEPEKPRSAYPVNSQGRTYGVWTEADGYEDVPDLIYFRVDEATGGYLRREELFPYSYPVKTAEEQERYLEWYAGKRMKRRNDVSIDVLSLYNEQGEESRGSAWVALWTSGVGEEELKAELKKGNVLRPEVGYATAPAEVIPEGQRKNGTVNPHDLPDEMQELMDQWTVDGDWRRNSKGETYGNPIVANIVGYEPDLIPARATNGDGGYVRNKDFEYPGYPRAVTSRADEKAYYAWSKLQSVKPVEIPVYDLDGEVVGKFEITGRQVIHAKDDFQEQIGQVREDMKGGGWTDEEIDQVIADFKERRGWRDV